MAERLVDADGLLYHVLAPGGEPQVRGLLTDHVAYLRALLDAHEVSGEQRFLERAPSARTNDDRELSKRPMAAFTTGLRAANPSATSRIPIVRSWRTVCWPTRSCDWMRSPRDSAHRDRVKQTLAIYAGTATNAGSFAATFARALRRYLSPEVVVRIVGDREQRPTSFGKSRCGCRHRLLRFGTFSPQEAAAQALPAEPHPAAYVCVGTVCGAPVTQASELRAAYDALAP